MSRLTYLPRDRTEEPVERRCHSKLSNRWAFLCTLRPNCVDGDPSMSTLTTTIDLEQIHILGDHAIRALPELTEVTTKWLINKDPVEGCSTIRSRISRMSGRKPMTGTGRSSRKLPLAIHSPAYESGPYSTEDEGGVMQFRGVVFELHAGASSGRAELMLMTIHREHTGMSALHDGGGPIVTISTPERIGEKHDRFVDEE